jgi:hypothetical protein
MEAAGLIVWACMTRQQHHRHGGQLMQQKLIPASSSLALQLHPVADLCGCYTRSVGLSCSTAVQLLPEPACNCLPLIACK